MDYKDIRHKKLSNVSRKEPNKTLINSNYFKNLKDNTRLWDIFTSKEEYNNKLSDKYGRFLYRFSKNKESLKPQISKFFIDKGLDIRYPKGRKFAVLLSHDIDLVYSLNSAYAILEEIKKRNYNKLFNFPFERFNKDMNSLWNFQDIISLEKRYDAKSTFNFLSLNRGERGFNYDIKKLKKEIENIHSNGWEIGLHGGFEASTNLEKIKIEKKKLEEIFNRKVIGYRSHYLKFEIPKTWEILHKAGFKYDTTFGYPDMVGFRNGMCHPFKPFNRNTNKVIDILEIPLNIMDSTLYDYMNLDKKNSLDVIKSLVDTTKKYNGVLTVLWHNTNMFDSNRELYETLLKYCKENNAWMTSGEEIWKWWKDCIEKTME